MRGTTRSVHQPSRHHTGRERRPARYPYAGPMSVRRVMGTEVEYGISVVGQPLANPMVASSQVVNAYASATVKARRARWDFEEESPLRDARGFDMSRQIADPTPAHRRGPRAGQRHPDQRRAALRRPRAPGVLHARGHHPARHRAVGQGGGAGHARRLPAGRSAAGRLADRLLQEQHRQQGRVVRRPRELPDAALHAVRRHRPAPDAVLREPPGLHRRRAGRDRPGRPRARLPAQPARRLLRGRGRPRDHAEAPDHQHPRRAARRPGEVPPAARDHRRRQPGRDLDLPQGRDHRAGAGDDRGPVHHPGPHRSTARSRRCARSRTTRRSSRRSR